MPFWAMMMLERSQAFEPAEKQNSCELCIAKLRNCRRNAKRQGKQAVKTYTAIVKMGGSALREMVENFEAQTLQYGRGHMRPPYGFSQYVQRVKMSTNVVVGNELVLMSQWRYAEHMRLEKGWEQQKAFDHFQELKLTLPKSQIEGDKIYVDAKKYVDANQVRAQEEELQYGHKAQKNPTPNGFAASMAWMGTDHAPVTDAANWERQMHLPAGTLSTLPEGVFSKPSELAPQEAQDRVAQWKEEEDKKKAEKLEAKKLRKAARPFECQAHEGIIVPSFTKKLTTKRDAFDAIVVKVNATLASCDLDNELKELTSSATNTLRNRLKCFENLRGDDNKTSAKHQSDWDDYKNSAEVKKCLTITKSPLTS